MGTARQHPLQMSDVGGWLHLQCVLMALHGLRCVGQRGDFSLVHDRFCPSMGHGKPNIDGFHLISITVIKTFARTS